MHKLDRENIPVPVCLARYKHGTDHWKDVSYTDKQTIREGLQQMQAGLCAYCEGDLSQLYQHIEHFRQQAHFPQLSFQWNNLFLSCDQQDSCGRYKDKQPFHSYKHENLLDPCVDDPDAFLSFASDGAIHPRENLSTKQRQRAEETLRIFGLDANWGRLRRMRQQTLKGYQLEKGFADMIENLEALTEEERSEYLSEEITAIRNHPFCTTIRHFLEGCLE